MHYSTREVAIGAATILAFAMLFRIRRARKAHRGIAAPSVSNLAFPITFSKETQEGLGLQLGTIASYQPRLTAVPILGMPEEGNPIESACLVLDVVPLVRDSSNTAGKRGEVEDALFTALTSGNETEILACMHRYALTACPFLSGEQRDESVLKCERVTGTPLSLMLPAETSSAKGDKNHQQKTDVKVEFSFRVTANGATVYLCPIPQAFSVLTLLIVPKETTASAADESDRADISTALRTAFMAPVSAIKQLVASNEKQSATTITETDGSHGHSNEEGSTLLPTVSHAVLQNSALRIRAVLPSAETKVAEVLVPSNQGVKELFITIEGLATHCRISHFSKMPSSWEDESAITDPVEKVDEFRRNLMLHFLGIISNSITLHQVDIGGRDCLWFSENSNGSTCRTYVCPNFDISGKKIKTRKGASNAKEMIIIRWEAPTDVWDQSLPALHSFIEYFQFE
eukprot:GILI01028722.1.p1 GENE.GILI01028722.1~~GILI01028722.1.p1  ORF type:complete len:458 (+),score=69.78 GILI01028722.1:116-1489(+)